MRTTFAFAAALIFTAPGWAASPDGFYLRPGQYPLTANIIATEGTASFAGKFTTGRPGDPNRCGGEFAATGRMDKPGTVVFTGQPNDDETCKVTATFNKTFGAVSLSSEGCSFYHGTSCDFDGSAKRVR